MKKTNIGAEVIGLAFQNYDIGNAQQIKKNDGEYETSKREYIYIMTKKINKNVEQAIPSTKTKV